ncbi:MAG TPA: STAS domain-containing protein [Pilimelia sp.]|nr:STAS domain-containing protein [Pilimelia sp.]
MDLQHSSVRLTDGTVEITPRGEIDLNNAYRIREAVNEALAGSPSRVSLNLAAVTLIDSVGIGTLVSCFHSAAASGVRLVVTAPSRIVYRQLWVSGLVGLFGLPTPRAERGAAAAT